MYWSQTESSKWSLDSLSFHPRHPFKPSAVGVRPAVSLPVLSPQILFCVSFKSVTISSRIQLSVAASPRLAGVEELRPVPHEGVEISLALGHQPELLDVEIRWLRRIYMQGGSATCPASPEDSFGARSCLGLPQASASLGQSAVRAAMAGHIGLWFRHNQAYPQRRRASCAIVRAHPSRPSPRRGLWRLPRGEEDWKRVALARGDARHLLNIVVSK